MEIREFDSATDYNDLARWWSARNLPIAPLNYLEVPGFIVLEGDRKLCAGFLYQMGITPMYSLDGIVSNPECPRMERKQALDLIIKDAIELCKALGGDLLMGFTHTPGLQASFEANGFQGSNRTFNHLGRLV